VFPLAGVPEADLVREGLADLAAGTVSPQALLVSIAAPKLRQLGIDVPRPIADPDLKLYRVLAAVDADGAHSRYKALMGKLVSFERACAS